jgi:hypothetical protein
VIGSEIGPCRRAALPTLSLEGLRDSGSAINFAIGREIFKNKSRRIRRSLTLLAASCTMIW